MPNIIDDEPTDRPQPADALADTLAANAAYLRWRGRRVSAAWRRRQTPAGVVFARGKLLVMTTLEPADDAGARRLTVSVSRTTGAAPSDDDVRAVLAEFASPDAEMRRELRGTIVYLTADLSFRPGPQDVRGWADPARAHRVEDRGDGVTTMGLDDVPVPGPGWTIARAAGLPIYVGPRARAVVMQSDRGGARWRQLTLERAAGEGAGVDALLERVPELAEAAARVGVSSYVPAL